MKGDKKKDCINAGIVYRIKMLHVTQGDVADAISMSRASFARRMADPGKWTVNELILLSVYFKAGMDEIITGSVT